MHITKTISNQMKRNFDSTNCSAIRDVSFSIDETSNAPMFVIKFIYGFKDVTESQELLTLRFVNVREFNLESCDSGGVALKKKLIKNSEDGSSLHIGDELGDFGLVCEDVEFVNIEPLRWR